LYFALKLRRNGIAVKKKLADGIKTQEDFDGIVEDLKKDIVITPSEMHNIMAEGRTWQSKLMLAETQAIELQGFVVHFVEHIGRIIQLVIAQAIEEKYINKQAADEIIRIKESFEERQGELQDMGKLGESPDSLTQKNSEALEKRNAKLAHIFFNVACWSLDDDQQVKKFVSSVKVNLNHSDLMDEENIRKLLEENKNQAAAMLASGKTMVREKSRGIMAEMEKIVGTYRDLKTDMQEDVEALQKAKKEGRDWQEAMLEII
jgi:hypothetical protein